jgi:hypothetical protein
LADFSLLDLDLRAGIVRLHDEIRLYLGRAIASEEAQKLHLRLLEGYSFRYNILLGPWS